MLYAFIYTGETVREVPAVVVDGANTALSRDFVRRVDASPDVKVVARTGNMEEAKELMRRTKAYGIIRIPDDFSRKVNRMQQAYVGLYCDMSGLLYYKALLTACTDVSLDMNTELQIKRMGNTTVRQDEVSTAPLLYESVALFNPTNGFCLFPDSGCVDAGHPADTASGYRTDKRFCPRTGYVAYPTGSRDRERYGAFGVGKALST